MCNHPWYHDREASNNTLSLSPPPLPPLVLGDFGAKGLGRGACPLPLPPICPELIGASGVKSPQIAVVVSIARQHYEPGEGRQMLCQGQGGCAQQEGSVAGRPGLCTKDFAIAELQSPLPTTTTAEGAGLGGTKQRHPATLAGLPVGAALSPVHPPTFRATLKPCHLAPGQHLG